MDWTARFILVIRIPAGAGDPKHNPILPDNNNCIQKTKQKTHTHQIEMKCYFSPSKRRRIGSKRDVKETEQHNKQLRDDDKVAGRKVVLWHCHTTFFQPKCAEDIKTHS